MFPGRAPNCNMEGGKCNGQTGTLTHAVPSKCKRALYQLSYPATYRVRPPHIDSCQHLSIFTTYMGFHNLTLTDILTHKLECFGTVMFPNRQQITKAN